MADPLELAPASTATTPDAELQAVAAVVADPLWFLARQWQTRGYAADDAGSPVRVSLIPVTTPLLAGGDPVELLDPLVEAETRPDISALDLGDLVGLGTELRRLLTEHGAGGAHRTLAVAFPFAPAGAGPRVQAFAGRVPDPRALYATLTAALGAAGTRGVMPVIPGLDPGLADRTERACRAWLAWLEPRLSPSRSASTDPPAWDPERLEYAFTLEARTPDGGVGLVSPEYHGAGVEWHTFDRSAPDPAHTGGVGTQVEAHPVPVTYPGMPRPRFWEFEDGHVNLDALAAVDPAHAVLVAFAHGYANDWFLIPLTVPPGVSTITGLTVLDNFGTTTAVPSVAAVDRGRGPWRLWELSSTDPGADPSAGAGLRVLVPPTPAPLRGVPVEDVLVVRDEFANLAWLVELTTADGDGEAVDRFQRYLRLRPPTDPAFDAGGRPENRLAYRLGTAVPDYWYPLTATTDAAGRPLLALGSLPEGAAGVSDEGVRGTVVPHQPGSVIADEEVPREGAHVTRQDRLLPAPGGGVVVWRARTKTPARGEASSGLRFDVLE